MKPVAFDYARPRSVAEALDLLAANGSAKILAGGQTLGPMLNLRLAQPDILIDVTRISELTEVREQNDGLAIGACVTHAAIEDGRLADPANGFLRRVASGIAYRAVRARGTIGGSLSHADPAADWLSALMALDAEVEIAGTSGTRRVRLDRFVKGVMEPDLGVAELVIAIHVPASGKGTHHGYHKICRKMGEFADAIGAVTITEGRGAFRMIAGGGSQPPLLLSDPAALFRDGDPLNAGAFDTDMAMSALHDAGMEPDDYELRIHAAAMNRAVREALHQ
jgi:carbon-monoxide dehydrogenase medium subunit